MSGYDFFNARRNKTFATPNTDLETGWGR